MSQFPLPRETAGFTGTFLPLRSLPSRRGDTIQRSSWWWEPGAARAYRDGRACPRSARHTYICTQVVVYVQTICMVEVYGW